MDDHYQGSDLIFLISQPRSGSTLLQRVLSGHSEIHTSAETWMMLHPIYSQRDAGIETEFNSRWRREAMVEFLENYTDGTNVEDDAIRAYAQVIYRAALDRTDCRYFLDKTPRYFFIIPELKRLFPQAKFVFLLRNPLAVLASELKTYVKGDWQILSWFAPDLVDAPRLILEAMTQFGDCGHVLRYEDFVLQPEEQTERLCRFLGLEYMPSMVEYASTPAPKGSMNDPIGVHKHSRPQAASVESWKSLADDPQTALFAHGCLQSIGTDTLAGLGYDFQELQAELGPVPAESPELYPWQLALKDPASFTLREQYRDEQYLAAHRYPTNALMSGLGAKRRFVQRLRRGFWEALGDSTRSTA